jgi:uncharacterized protein (TIGR01370 family)
MSERDVDREETGKTTAGDSPAGTAAGGTPPAAAEDEPAAAGAVPPVERRPLVIALAAVVALALLVGIVVLTRRGSGADGTAPGDGTTAPGAAGATTTVPDAAGGPGAVPEPGAPAPGAPGDAAAPPPVAATPAATARLAGIRSWSFALGAAVSGRSGADLAAQFKGFDLVVLDGTDVSAEAVAALRAQGAVVLAYANVGAIEEDRPWSEAARAYRLDYWEQWNEWYADVTRPGFRTLVTDTIVAPMLAKGVDGLFLDNVDMVDTHPAQRAAMVGLVAQLSATVRAKGQLLFAQNGEDATVDAVLPYLDGWNREDVSVTYDDDEGTYVPVPERDKQAAVATLRRLKARGVLVTSVDYVADAAGAEAREALRTACAAGAVASVADIGLTRIFPPHRC